MILKPTNRGSLTLPPALRSGLPREALFDVVRRDDGVIELRPRIAVRPRQAWFYGEVRQKMEREADADIAAGRVEGFESGEEFQATLEAEDARLRAEGR